MRMLTHVYGVAQPNYYSTLQLYPCTTLILRNVLYGVITDTRQ